MRDLPGGHRCLEASGRRPRPPSGDARRPRAGQGLQSLHARASMLNMQRCTGSRSLDAGVLRPGSGVPAGVADDPPAEQPAGKVCKLCGELIVGDGRRVLHAECQFVDGLRRCVRCLLVKPDEAYSNDNRRPGRKYPWCKKCQTAYLVGKKHQNADGQLNGHRCSLCDTEIRGHPNRRFCSNACKQRVASLRKNFGLTVDEYRLMVDGTEGRCPICTEETTSWHVDHDHSTGKVTGVVCGSCNIGALARTYHSPAFIRRLLSYIEDTPASQLGIEAVSTGGRPSNLHAMWGRDRDGRR